MSESNNSVRMTYIGIPNSKDTYMGDGIYCSTKNPDSCNVDIPQVKAAQLLKDFPEEWEINPKDLNGQSVIKFIQQHEYSNKMIGTAEAKKGVKVIYPDGSEMTYPAGTEVQVKTPEHKPIMKEI